jgi:hypothetical protein
VPRAPPRRCLVFGEFGRVVTGTINHLNGEVMRLRLAGGAILEPTQPHRLFSHDRHDWVAARDLKAGERLRTDSGAVAIESLRRRPGIHRVYNLEVEHERVYHVGNNRVLAHNSYSDFLRNIMPNGWDNAKLGEMMGWTKGAKNPYKVLTKAEAEAMGWTKPMLQEQLKFWKANNKTERISSRVKQFEAILANWK